MNFVLQFSAKDLLAGAEEYRQRMKIQADFAESHRVEREKIEKEAKRLQQMKLDKEMSDAKEAKKLQLTSAQARRDAANANLKRMTKTLEVSDMKKLEDAKLQEAKL